MSKTLPFQARSDNAEEGTVRITQLAVRDHDYAAGGYLKDDQPTFEVDGKRHVFKFLKMCYAATCVDEIMRKSRLQAE